MARRGRCSGRRAVIRRITSHRKWPLRLRLQRILKQQRSANRRTRCRARKFPPMPQEAYCPARFVVVDRGHDRGHGRGRRPGAARRGATVAVHSMPGHGGDLGRLRLAWGRRDWPGVACDWPGVACDWPGVACDWPGVACDWPGVACDWPGVACDWPGVACDWPGVACDWPGVACDWPGVACDWIVSRLGRRQLAAGLGTGLPAGYRPAGVGAGLPRPAPAARFTGRSHIRKTGKDGRIAVAARGL